jgi:hypothetical protein
MAGASSCHVHGIPKLMRKPKRCLKNFQTEVEAAVATHAPNDPRPVLQMARMKVALAASASPDEPGREPGIRPFSPRQVVRESTSVYAAVAPATGKVTSLILPTSDTAMMNLFLAHVSQTFAAYFIVMQVDRTGWHQAKDLLVPDNIRLIPQPAYSPERESHRTSLGTPSRKALPQFRLCLP